MAGLVENDVYQRSTDERLIESDALAVTDDLCAECVADNRCGGDETDAEQAPNEAMPGPQNSPYHEAHRNPVQHHRSGNDGPFRCKRHAFQ